jgi:choloylglycine hydrolase
MGSTITRNVLVTILILGIVLVFYVTTYGKESQDLNPSSTEENNATLDTFYSRFEQIDDHLFLMVYEGDYGFKEYLETGRPVYSFNRGRPPSCTCFTATNLDSGRLFGRNFDFPDDPALVLYTNSSDGYASISIVDLGYFGYNSQKLPDPEDGLDNLRLVPLLPFDGMNEHGLTVGMAAVPEAEAPVDPEKITIGEIRVLRMVLDYAKDVEEAIDLIQSYNVRVDEPPIHYLLADRNGNSVIIEFVEGEMIVYRNDREWQIITNFIMTGSDAPQSAPCNRYDTVHQRLGDSQGRVSLEKAMELLEASSQDNTVWSAVYDLENLELYVSMQRDYGNIMNFKLIPD